MVKPEFENQPVVKFARAIIKYKWLTIAFAILGTLALGSGARFLQFTNNYRVFFGEDNPQLLAFEELENSYTKSDNILIIVSPKSKQVFSRDSLKVIQEVTKESWQIPYSTRVDSITNFQHTTAKGDDLFVADLVKEDTSKITDAQLEEIKQIALGEPILKDLLITERADVTAVSTSIQLPEKDPNEVIEVNTFVRDIRDRFQKKYPEFEFRISGVVAMNNAFAELGQKDAATLTPIMYLFMLIIMAVLLRSFVGTVVSLLVIIFSTIAAMGFAGYVGIQLTPPSAIAPTVIMTLAIADSVHILMSMLFLMKKGWKKTEALVESMRINFQAVFITSATTAIGFICLNFSDAPPFHDLGNITAAGVMLAFLLSVTLLPALVAALPARVKVTEKEDQEKETYLDRLANHIIKQRKPYFFIILALFIFLTAAIRNIDVNDEFVKWFDQRVEFRQNTDYLNENLTGIYSFLYSIPSGEAEGISQPQYMAKVSEFANWWRQQPETIHVATYTDIMKKLNKTLHADAHDWYKLPDNLDLASQYLLLYEMSLPFGLDLNNQIDIDKSAVKMVITVKTMTSTMGRVVSKRGDDWLVANAPSVMHTHATGPSVMFSHISKRNVDSMIKGTTFAFILITLIMIISLQSLKYGMISLLPNIMPALMAFGLWSITVNQVGMAIAVVASATLGIIVDDSVHFLTKYLRAKKENNLSSEDAIRYAFSSVGHALVTTSIVLVVGFLILTYSSFLLNWTLGVLSAITIAIALFVDFFFLPPLLMFLEKSNTAKEA